MPNMSSPRQFQRLTGFLLYIPSFSGCQSPFCVLHILLFPSPEESCGMELLGQEQAQCQSPACGGRMDFTACCV